ncbi:MAG: hypothetical protein ACI9X4_000589 [Glaciecola sp.]|jgi:hypothetical protein
MRYPIGSWAFPRSLGYTERRIMRFLKTTFPLALAVLFLAAHSACAQIVEGGEPVEDNVGHKRHEHRWGKPHETDNNPARFHTNRKGRNLLLPNEKDAFSFVIFGDRTGGPASGVSVLADAVRDTNLLEPDFVMTIGDHVEGFNQTELWMKEMREYRAIMSNLLCPWLPVAGNHDIYWRGPDRPEGEHESSYEMHFGPLWYAFEHKKSWFVALYSDEGDPLTGTKDANDPACQTMSPEQFEWLQGILNQAKDAEHVFVFIHHPRWTGLSNYGDDWDKVHKILLEAGNVSMVFGGHIHHMRYDRKDSIEYVTLATVGASHFQNMPQVGWLHEYHLVTVRKDQVAVTAIPVGEAIDVRELTGDLTEQAKLLGRQVPKFKAGVSLSDGAALESEVEVSFTNPAKGSIDAMLSLESADSRWGFTPDHAHATLKPGETLTFRTTVRRPDNSLDRFFRPANVRLSMDYLMPGHRYHITDVVTALPLKIVKSAPALPKNSMSLDLRDSEHYLAIPSTDLALPDGPFTVECWVHPESIVDIEREITIKDPTRGTGIVSKFFGTDFGLFMEDGYPQFQIVVGGQQVRTQNRSHRFELGRWYHLAGVFDGAAMRFYLNGKLLESLPASGPRSIVPLPLYLGGHGSADLSMSFPFHGYLDGVHVSTSARYMGDSFKPFARPVADKNTVLLLNMDAMDGVWLFDETFNPVHPIAFGKVQLIEASGR